MASSAWGPLVIATVVGLAVGGMIAWLAARARAVGELTRLAATLEAERARHAAALATEQRHAQEREALVRQSELQLKEAFRALSADALRENAESFLQVARGTLDEVRTASSLDLEGRQRAIGDMLSPLREALDRVDGNLRQVEVARAGAYESLLTQVASLADVHRELSGRTRTLVDALKSPVVRGRWGEVQLRRVCEMAQMVEHVDFVEQESVGGPAGVLRPDVQVRLPGAKIVIVDAKAPLQAYLDALEAPDDAAREALLRQHARQVRDHITRLSAKGYWEQFPQAPEFVVMFLPGETFFSTALQYDPTLIEYGVERRVIPASPTTLIALLRAVSYGWQQEQVSRGAETVRALGRELYDRLRSFSTHLDEMRRGLEKAVDAYNRSVGSLEQSVLPQARRFRELGVASAVDLPTLEGIDRALRVPRDGEAGRERDGARDHVPDIARDHATVGEPRDAAGDTPAAHREPPVFPSPPGA
ncbi:MAG: DNA recombination protein RmuC [Gemmatimonadetes bacterium]|nr:DNA recombination protein RmuC [Gemmatimonadota bacterium]